MEGLDCFILGCFGAMAVEIFKLYERKEVLATAKFRRMIRSPLYWVLFIAFISASGFIAWAASYGSPAQPWAVVLSGIGACAIARMPAEVNGRKTRLGDGVLGDIFG